MKNWYLADFEGIAVGDWWILRNNNISAEFIYNLIKTQKYQYVSNLSTGTKMPRADWRLVSETIFSIPNELSEQQKIGILFSQLDNLITLHQRKLDALKRLKEGYLQQMFPQKGEVVPKVRFANFSEEWEERKLGEIGNTYNGLSGKTKKDFGKGTAEFITYLNVFNNPLSDISLTESIEVDSKQNEVKYGDVLFTVSSETPEEVGMSSVWLDNRPNIYLNSFCFGFRASIPVQPNFLAYLLRTTRVRKQFFLLAQGISRYNISRIKSMDIKITLPKISEQELISYTFKRLDTTITHHQQMLEKIKSLKKAYLQKMFI